MSKNWLCPRVITKHYTAISFTPNLDDIYTLALQWQITCTTSPDVNTGQCRGNIAEKLTVSINILPDDDRK